MGKTMTLSDKISRVCIWAFVGLGVAFGIYALTKGNIPRGLLGLAAPAFLIVPYIFKWLGIKKISKLNILLFSFLVLAYDFGCVLQLFDRILYFDKFSHFLSGIIFTIMGFCIYYYFEKPFGNSIGEKWILAMTYAFFFSLFVGVVWEICEFSGFLLTGHDSQHHLTTGVFDTMGDLISCFIASLFSVASYILYVKKGVKLVTGVVVAEFYEAYDTSKSLVKKAGKS